MMEKTNTGISLKKSTRAIKNIKPEEKKIISRTDSSKNKSSRTKKTSRENVSDPKHRQVFSHSKQKRKKKPSLKKTARPSKQRLSVSEKIKKFEKNYKNEIETAAKATKKIGKGVIAAIIIAGLVLIALFFAGIKVSFILNDELLVNILPMDKSINILNNESAEVMFLLKTDGFIQCRAQCETELFDVSENKTYFLGMHSPKHKEDVYFNYTFLPEKKGLGQKLFVVMAKCRNIKSGICFTEEDYRFKSSLIVINYNLTEEEINAVEKSKQTVENLLGLLYNSSAIVMQNEYLLENMPFFSENKESLAAMTGILKEKLEEQEKEITAIIGLWDESEYIKLSRAVSEWESEESLFAEAEKINSMLKAGQESIIGEIRLWNSYISSFEEIKKNNAALESAYNFYINEYNQNNYRKLLDIGLLSKALYEIYTDTALNSENKPVFTPDSETRLNIFARQLNAILEEYQKDMAAGEFNIIQGSAVIYLKEKGLIQSTPGDFSINYYLQALTENKSATKSETEHIRANICNLHAQLIEKIQISNNISGQHLGSLYNLSNETAEFDFCLNYAKECLLDESYLKAHMVIKAAEHESEKMDYLLNASESALAKRGILATAPENSSPCHVLDKSCGDFLELANADWGGITGIIIIPNETYLVYYRQNCRNLSFNSDDETAKWAQRLLEFNYSKIFGLKTTTTIPSVFLNKKTALSPLEPYCCTFNECVVCLDNKSLSPKTPVLFIHGHAFNDKNTPEFTMNAFGKIERALMNYGYINAGQLDLSVKKDEVIYSDWGRSGRPVAARASYYYISYYDFGAYTITAQKSERIENYALRLKEIIELYKYRTGAERVNIVAHSMGGLVARQYLALFGGDDIEKLILVNTPNHGVSGKVKKFCSVIGAERECEDLSDDSVFISRLNSYPLPKETKIFAIRSEGCAMENNANGDGIVTNESAYLTGAHNLLIKGECTDALKTDLHSAVFDPDLYPQTLEIIKDILMK